MPFGYMLRNFTGRVEKLDAAIDLSRIEVILLNHYTVGTKDEGADAYPLNGGIVHVSVCVIKWCSIHGWALVPACPCPPLLHNSR